MSSAVDRTIRDAKTALRAGQGRVARRTLLEMMERFPANPRLQSELAAVVTAISGLPARGFGPAHVKRVVAMLGAGAIGEAIEEMVALALLNPANPMARNVLGRLYIDAGVPQAALPHLIAASRTDPAFREAQVNLATVYLQLGRAAEAVAPLEAVLKTHPDFIPALDMLGRVLTALERGREAVAPFRRLLALQPGDSEVLLSLASALSAAQETTEARTILQGIVARDPANFRVHNNLANIELAEGRLTEAETHARAAIEGAPLTASGNAYYNLGRIITFAEGDPAIAAMQALARRKETMPPDEQVALMFALSKALEDIGAVDESFAALAEANRLKRATLSYSLDMDRKLLDGLRRRFAAAVPGLPAADLPPPPVVPIFVVGMMRSGTTLTEQIISAHSQVHGAGELRFLGATAEPELSAHDGPLDAVALQRIRGRYLAELAALAGGAPYAVDKLPANFRFIGLIRKALPEARIVHLRRDPVAVCWSNYKTYFNAQNIGYAWDLQEVAGYYRLYEDFMAQMDGDYPGQILTVDYAALTETPEPVIRGILDFCGLPFEESCLRPQENTRAVRTASVRQVRSGIYKGSNSKWRGFEPHMGPLLQALARP